jgi:NADH-quinone oxidoreductase subunit M
MMLLLLTALLVLMAVAASPGQVTRPKLYYALVLFLQAGLFGTFTALNFFHWFLFWELSLVPAFFLVRLWGGVGRVEAATQFFIYTMVGSVALLLGFVAVYLVSGSFNFPELAAAAQSGDLFGPSRTRLGMVVFLCVFLGFAVKVPLAPFHTWLPSTYAAAPFPVTMLLTGLMSKMGVYGFIRILLPIFGEQIRAATPWLLALAVFSVVYSAAAALGQKELRRMLAYSSVNHLGYCILGVFVVAQAPGSHGLSLAHPALEATAALNGVFLQMFNHGLTAAALFWLLGMLESRRGQNLTIDDFGGLRTVAPVYAGVFGVALFSSLGLPGLNGFVGEFLIFKGVFPLAPWAATFSLLGLLLTAIFLLAIMQRVFSGPVGSGSHGVADLTRRERWLLAPAIGLMFLLGFFPQLLVGLFNGTASRLAQALAP